MGSGDAPGRQVPRPGAHGPGPEVRPPTPGDPRAALPPPSAHPRRDTDAHSPDTHRLPLPLALGGELQQLRVRPGPGGRVCAVRVQTGGASLTNRTRHKVRSAAGRVRGGRTGADGERACRGPPCSSPARRSPRSDTLINVSFYPLSQGPARVCKHPAALCREPAGRLAPHRAPGPGAAGCSPSAQLDRRVNCPAPRRLPEQDLTSPHGSGLRSASCQSRCRPLHGLATSLSLGTQAYPRPVIAPGDSSICAYIRSSVARAGAVPMRAGLPTKTAAEASAMSWIYPGLSPSPWREHLGIDHPPSQ
ncbi:uncharacterized protein LOC119865751 isoform X1 [Canis lupus familiaris]|uniref:uncharacterized protein LOC119865751 isoform X1 n=1 Tax=Canis lupus familiaris TaxID=9615 RepID=UPI0018F7D890|nr:uncharacterized protein LOC119865751 isoform X1 [Canis lupus familiaris]